MKNIFKSLNLNYLPLFFVILIFLIFPFVGYAGGLGDIFLGAILLAVNLILGLIFTVLIAVTNLFVSIAQSIFSWVISPSFITFSYTIPCAKYNPLSPENCNPIVGIGLSITKGFVNLILSIFLVIIALSIALRIERYGTVKIFARLIIIALLVNFAPVLVGIAVDLSNIVMNFFLKSISESGIGFLGGGRLASFVDNVLGSFKNLTSVEASINLIAQGIVLIIVNIFLIIAFFLFAGFFISRYIIIWILTILSPLALVAWVLPATKRYFESWLNSLNKWLIMGIPISFFLYLALTSFSFLQKNFEGGGIKTDIGGFFSSFFNNIFPYVIVIALMFLGFSVGAQLGMAGAGAVANFAKERGKKAAFSGAKLAGRNLTKATNKALGEKGRNFLANQANAKFIPDKIPGGKIGKSIYALTVGLPTYVARRGIGAAYSALNDKQFKDVRKSKQENKDTSAREKLSNIRSFDHIEKIGALLAAIEEGQIGELRKLGLSDDEVTKIGKEAASVDPSLFKEIIKGFPHLAEKMAKEFSPEFKDSVGLGPLTDEEKKDGMTITMRILSDLKPKDIPKVDPEVLTKNISYFFSKHASAAQVAKLLEEGPKKAVDMFIKIAKERGLDVIEAINPGVVNYLRSNPGIRATRGELFSKSSDDNLYGGEI